jgi:hypothetical protein
MLVSRLMKLAKPTFPAPDHDHGRCTADALQHAERVCAKRSQKLTPIRRKVLETLLSSHRPLGAYEVIGADHGLPRAGLSDGKRPCPPHRKPQRLSSLRA